MHIRTSDQAALKLGWADHTCNWGVHMAGLYETEQERDDIILGFLHQGAVDGDLQLYCPAERTVKDFQRAYGARFPEETGHLQQEDCFQLYRAQDLYYPDGTFSPVAMDSGLAAFYEQSQSRGPRNIRATAEMVWALEAIPGVEHLMAYESRLNYFIPNKPWISICLYNVAKFSGAMIMDVLRTHPFTISQGLITENPYYLPPDEWLARHAPAFLPNKAELKTGD